MARAISWAELCEYEGLLKHNVDIFNDKGKKCGQLLFNTQLRWVEYVPPQPSEKLDKKSVLKVIIKEAQFKKDADTFGKQDPFISFKFQGHELKTDVKDDAGKSAKWDETFQLPNIMAQIRDGGSLTFEAYDKDVASSDLLGATDPVDFEDIVQDDSLKEWNLDLFDQSGEHMGNVKLSIQLVYSKPDPPIFAKINYNCQVEIKMLKAEFLKDEADALGK
jgi:Ca2+-dependent lipid-binding protein